MRGSPDSESGERILASGLAVLPALSRSRAKRHVMRVEGALRLNANALFSAATVSSPLCRWSSSRHLYPRERQLEFLVAKTR